MSREIRRPGRAGFAVAVVVLLLLGLTMLAHGALLLAARERTASALEASLSSRRVLSRASARRPAGSDTLPTLGSSALVLASGERPPRRWRTEALALDRELALLVGVGRLDGVPGEERTGVVAWRMDPSARVAAAEAVVEVGGDAAGAGVDASGWLRPPDPWTAATCRSELAALDTLGAVVPPAVAALAGAASELPGLGLLPGDSVMARAALRVSGTVVPEATTLVGECVASPTNWGSPGAPASACGGRMVLAASETDLTVVGGEGQGALVVRGRLTLTEGAVFAGVVLTGGDLVVERGARLIGAARVGGGLRASGGRIEGSACAAARALRSVRALRTPFLLAESGLLHPM